MVKIDMTQPDQNLVPGVFLVFVKAATVKKSKSGDDMIGLELGGVERPATRLYDNIMLAGGGWPMGKQKLTALGLGEDFTGDFDVANLNGRRVWVATKIETYKGKDKLSIDIQQLKYAGMQPEDDVPGGCVAPEKYTDEATPF